MRILKNTLASAALAGMLAVQPVAAAAQAAPAIERTGTTVEDAEAQRRGITPVLVVLAGFVVTLLLLDFVFDVVDVFEDPASP